MTMWSDLDTREKVSAILPLVRPGVSASSIAAELRTTRNAIIGTCWRAEPRIALSGVMGRNPDKPRRRKRRAVGPALTVAVVLHRSLRAGAVMDEPAIKAPAVDRLPSMPMPFLDASPHRCRYILPFVDGVTPIEEKLICGAPTGGSWCDYHLGVVFDTRVRKR